MTIQFTIPLNPVTKKNSGRIVTNGKHPFILPSKAFNEYEEAAGYLIPAYAKKCIDRPVNIKAVYYRKTKHRVDISNLHSALHDVLVTHGVLKDDSSISPCIVFSTDGSYVDISTDNPRTEIEITEV